MWVLCDFFDKERSLQFFLMWNPKHLPLCKLWECFIFPVWSFYLIFIFWIILNWHDLTKHNIKLTNNKMSNNFLLLLLITIHLFFSMFFFLILSIFFEWKFIWSLSIVVRYYVKIIAVNVIVIPFARSPQHLTFAA